MINFKEKILYKNIVILIVLTMFFVLDRFLKFLALKMEGDLILIKNFLMFSFYPNKYISFSIPIGGQALNILLLFLILSILVYLFLLFKKNRWSEFWSWLAIFFGAISNFIDRIFFSYVIDYIDLRFFTVFNLADVLIVGGCFYIIFFNFNLIKKEKKQI